MSNDQHASIPGAAGSIGSPAKTEALIQLTRNQYYFRLAAAFMVGAAIGGGIAFLVLRLADEPPIKVRGGGLGVEIISTKPNVEWEDTGSHWKVKAPGINFWGEYKVNFNIGSNCANSGPVPGHVKSTHLVIGDLTYEVTTHGINTVMKPKGEWKKSSTNPMLLEHPGDGSVTIQLTEPAGKVWECRFEAGQFQELCLHTNGC